VEPCYASDAKIDVILLIPKIGISGCMSVVACGKTVQSICAAEGRASISYIGRQPGAQRVCLGSAEWIPETTEADACYAKTSKVARRLCQNNKVGPLD
jgi:hypothetical protein